MLINKFTKKEMIIPGNRELSDHMKRITIEKCVPATHKGHAFFSIEQRAKIK